MPSPSTIFVIVIIVLVCVGTLGMVLLKAAAWLAFRREGVNAFEGEWEDDEDDRTSSEPPARRVEPGRIADTSQVEPIDPPVRDPSPAPLIIAHKMSRKDLTLLLAVQKNDDGAYRWSANKIAEFIGGTSAEVKGWVAEVRGKKESAAAANTLRRPANGW